MQGDLLQLSQLFTQVNNADYVIKPLMWCRPEQPSAPSSWTPSGRHISYRVIGPQGIPSAPRSPWGSESPWPAPAIRAPATPGRFEAARRWLCGAPDRGRAESSASTGRRPHNSFDHITAANSPARRENPGSDTWSPYGIFGWLKELAAALAGIGEQTERSGAKKC